MTTDTMMAKQRQMMARLARVEGQLRGVQKLIAAGTACEPVAQQLCAARKALDKAFFHMLVCMLEEGEVSPGELAKLLAKYA